MKHSLIVFYLIGLLSLAFTTVQPTSRLYLEPAPLQDDRLLVVDVVLEDVTQLYGADVQLRYDPAQLQVQDASSRLEGIQITPGALLPDDQRLVVQNVVDPDQGLISFAATLINPAPAVTGGGSFATITFRVIGAGPLVIEVTRAELVAVDLSALPVSVENLELAGGLPETVFFPAPSAPLLPWWGWIGLFVLVTGVLTLITIIFSRRSTPTPTPVRRIPRTSRPSTRSSALLVEQGERAMNQGNLETAYELFSQAIELDPANAGAWLGKGLVAQQETEKRICFERVLALDPDNSVAKAALAR